MQLTAKFWEVIGSCKTLSNDNVQSWAWLVFELFLIIKKYEQFKYFTEEKNSYHL